MASLMQRLSGVFGAGPLPRIKPTTEMGHSGTAISGGWVRNIETSADWAGRQRYKTIGDLVSNVSIVSAGVHYFLNLISHPNWNVTPVSDKDPKAREMAEFVEDVMYDMQTSWARVVRRSGNFRFYGFGVQEWVAKKRDDGRNGLLDIEPRPQHTIETWVVSDQGSVDGMWQRSPQTGELLGLPRGKLIYLVDDTLTDNPEGFGSFRHMADAYKRLKQLQDLEVRAFERDLRGIPIGRAPISAINAMVKNNEITQAQGTQLITGMQDFVKLQVRQSDTGIVLDSQPYESQSVAGLQVSGSPQWGLELLTGSAAGLAELDQAINRIQREMARIIGVETLMMGSDGSGNRSLAEDKSRNLYLIANSVLSYLAEQFNNDVIGPLWWMNGFDDKLKPWFTVEDVAFKDAEMVARVLRDMSTAGAVLALDDPVIDDVRELLGVSKAPEPTPEQLAAAAAATAKEPAVDPDEEAEEEDLEKFFKGFDPNQPRDEKGQWTDVTTVERDPSESFNSRDIRLELERNLKRRGVIRSTKELVYHGTSDEAVAAIMENGLVPRGGPWGKQVWELEGDRATSVFVGPHLGYVLGYAGEAAKITGGKPVYFAIKIPADKKGNLVSDEVRTQALRYRGTIRPEWIVGKVDSKGRILVKVEDDGSVTFYGVILVDDGEDLEKAFDPNQPRDEKGRWSEVGGFANLDDGYEGMVADGKGGVKDTPHHGPDTEKKAEELLQASLTAPLTAQEKDAVNFYSGDGWEDVNRAARGGADTLTIRELDSAIAKSSLSESVTAFRGMTVKAWNGFAKKDVGAKWSDRKFLSTSLRENRAIAAVGVQGGTMRLLLPKGTKALPFGSMSNYTIEAEVLLPRSTRFKIVDIDKTNRRVTVTTV